MLGILCIAMPAKAEPITQQQFNNCFVVGTYGETIMTARQDGVPLSILLTSRTISHNAILKAFVVKTYTYDIGDTGTARNKIIGQYRKDTMFDCLTEVNNEQ